MKQDDTNETVVHSALDRLEKILGRISKRIDKVWAATVAWFDKRCEAIKEGLRMIYHVVKNGAKNGVNGNWVRFERAVGEFTVFVEKHSPLDGVILASLVAVIIGLIIITRRAV